MEDIKRITRFLNAIKELKDSYNELNTKDFLIIEQATLYSQIQDINKRLGGANE